MRFHLLLLGRKESCTGQPAVLRGKLPSRTTLDEPWLDNLSLHNFALHHTPWTLLWLLDHAFDFWCLRRFAFVDLNLFLFAEVMHVVGRAAFSAAHGRWVGLAFNLVLEAFVFVFRWAGVYG